MKSVLEELLEELKLKYPNKLPTLKQQYDLEKLRVAQGSQLVVSYVEAYINAMEARIKAKATK